MGLTYYTEEQALTQAKDYRTQGYKAVVVYDKNKHAYTVIRGKRIEDKAESLEGLSGLELFQAEDIERIRRVRGREPSVQPIRVPFTESRIPVKVPKTAVADIKKREEYRLTVAEAKIPRLNKEISAIIDRKEEKKIEINHIDEKINKLESEITLAPNEYEKEYLVKQINEQIGNRNKLLREIENYDVRILRKQDEVGENTAIIEMKGQLGAGARVASLVGTRGEELAKDIITDTGSVVRKATPKLVRTSKITALPSRLQYPGAESGMIGSVRPAIAQIGEVSFEEAGAGIPSTPESKLNLDRLKDTRYGHSLGGK